MVSWVKQIAFSQINGWPKIRNTIFKLFWVKTLKSKSLYIGQNFWTNAYSLIQLSQVIQIQVLPVLWIYTNIDHIHGYIRAFLSGHYGHFVEIRHFGVRPQLWSILVSMRRTGIMGITCENYALIILFSVECLVFLTKKTPIFPASYPVCDSLSKVCSINLITPSV